MSQKRTELSVTLGIDNKIYAIGGFGGISFSYLNSVERYDIKRNLWENVCNLNVPRRAA